LAAGAAEERLYLSFPRAEAETGRARVPSFYAIEAMRAASGEPPTLHAFERAARPPSRISAAWPSPIDPATAIDETELALAVVRGLKSAEPTWSRGRARFLVEQHPHLERALRARFRRHDQRELDVNDGFVATDPALKRHLEGRSLRERGYSPSTLQAFAACPYRFYLKALLGVGPRLEASPVDRLDPSQRGQLYHQCQAKLAVELGAMTSPPDAAEARAIVDRVLGEVAEAERERSEPLSRQVFEHQIEGLRLDLLGYLEEQAQRNDGYRPLRAELRFGLDGHEPVRIKGRYLVRGAIDAVELGPGNALRVTDYKTGRLDPELQKGTPAVGGGEMLQPLLYAMVADALRGRELPAEAEVAASRLYFATRRGGYRSLDVVVADDNLDRALEVMNTIDHAVRAGRLFALPREGACKACAYRAVCGPNEEARVARKQPATPDKPLIRNLTLLRGLP
ncbi:MAG: PD-(D/E)XK nuclease family protein, partial [Myxococcales bacterium]|nr:PD-(D/E)XK nuclease family protein [Myxococcales bacterium]